MKGKDPSFSPPRNHGQNRCQVCACVLSGLCMCIFYGTQRMGPCHLIYMLHNALLHTSPHGCLVYACYSMHLRYHTTMVEVEVELWPLYCLITHILCGPILAMHRSVHVCLDPFSALERESLQNLIFNTGPKTRNSKV